MHKGLRILSLVPCDKDYHCHRGEDRIAFQSLKFGHPPNPIPTRHMGTVPVVHCYKRQSLMVISSMMAPAHGKGVNSLDVVNEGYVGFDKLPALFR